MIELNSLFNDYRSSLYTGFGEKVICNQKNDQGSLLGGTKGTWGDSSWLIGEVSLRTVGET